MYCEKNCSKPGNSRCTRLSPIGLNGGLPQFLKVREPLLDVNGGIRGGVCWGDDILERLRHINVGSALYGHGEQVGRVVGAHRGLRISNGPMLDDEAMTMDIKVPVSHSSFVNNRLFTSRQFRLQKVPVLLDPNQVNSHWESWNSHKNSQPLKNCYPYMGILGNFPKIQKSSQIW